MIGILISLLVLLIVLYVVKLVIEQLGLPENIKNVALLIIGLIALLSILSKFGILL